MIEIRRDGVRERRGLAGDMRELAKTLRANNVTFTQLLRIPGGTLTREQANAVLSGCIASHTALAQMLDDSAGKFDQLLRLLKDGRRLASHYYTEAWGQLQPDDLNFQPWLKETEAAIAALSPPRSTHDA